MFNLKYLLLSIVLWSNLVIAEDTITTRCFNDLPVKEESYSNPQRGLVKLFILPNYYTITNKDLNCIVGHQFLKLVATFPEKMVVGIVLDNYEKLQLIQWDLQKQTFLLINVDTKITDGKNGIFTFYPQPLIRLKEILINKTFPTKEELPIEYRKKFKINYLKVTKQLLQRLIKDY